MFFSEFLIVVPEISNRAPLRISAGIFHGVAVGVYYLRFFLRSFPECFQSFSLDSYRRSFHIVSTFSSGVSLSDFTGWLFNSCSRDFDEIAAIILSESFPGILLEFFAEFRPKFLRDVCGIPGQFVVVISGLTLLGVVLV